MIAHKEEVADVSIVMKRDICHEIVLNLGVVVAVEDEEGEVSQDISEVLEFLKPREVNQLIALKKEVDESKKQMTENESAFKSRIKSKETNLNDIHVQLEQAQKLEESLKKDLRKVSKDIDVLQRQDLDIRNEISTENKHFHYSKSVRERNV